MYKMRLRDPQLLASGLRVRKLLIPECPPSEPQGSRPMAAHTVLRQTELSVDVTEVLTFRACILEPLQVRCFLNASISLPVKLEPQ